MVQEGSYIKRGKGKTKMITAAVKHLESWLQLEMAYYASNKNNYIYSFEGFLST